MERESRENRESEQDTVLAAIQRVLANDPETFGEQLEAIRQAAEKAQTELDQNGELSQTTAEELDDLFRPFKPESLK